jgi:hypothetical protein
MHNLIVQKVIAEFKKSHPTATQIRFSSETDRNIYIRYERPDLDACGLFVKGKAPCTANG